MFAAPWFVRINPVYAIAAVQKHTKREHEGDLFDKQILPQLALWMEVFLVLR